MFGRELQDMFLVCSLGGPRGHQAGTVMAMACMGDGEKYHDDFYQMLSKDDGCKLQTPGQPRGANGGTDPRHPYQGSGLT